jgi:succinate dehydrogenase/fumarate reductase cytochrome b subunit
MRAAIISCYARNRGWHYLISWLHRLTGVVLTITLTVCLYTLLLPQTSDSFTAKTTLPAGYLLTLLTWASSLVVGFHALNGGRLILYELFGIRNDAIMIRWTFSLTASYAVIVGIVMVLDNQRVSAPFFWLMTLSTSLAIACAVASRLSKSRHSFLWKLQRISGAFLFIAIPAYLLFTRMKPYVTDELRASVEPTYSVLTCAVFLAVAAPALYHALYGLFSIVADYLVSRTARAGLTAPSNE